MFDGSVNSGVASAKWLQRALSITVDGPIGDRTLLAAHDVNPASLIHSMCDQRRRFLQSLRTFKRFGKGWRATCWVTPKIVWKRFADHPANSLRARLGTVIATSPPSRPSAQHHGSKSKSLASHSR